MKKNRLCGLIIKWVYKNKEIVFGVFRFFRVNDEIRQIPYLPKIPTIYSSIDLCYNNLP